MVGMTQSFSKWLWDNHNDIFALVSFGHTELVTDEMYEKYLEWCQTEESKSYLKGGSNWDGIEIEVKE